MDPEKLEKRAFKRGLVGKLFKSSSQEAQDLYWSAGKLYKSRGQLKKAAECYMHGVRVFRSSGHQQADHYDYALEAGEIYVKTEDFKEAAKALELAIEIGAVVPTIKTAPAIKLLSQAYRQMGNIRKALILLKEAASVFDADGKYPMAAKCLLGAGELCARKASSPEMFLQAGVSYNYAVDYIKANELVLSHNTAIKQVFCGALAEEPLKEYNAVVLLDQESKQLIDKIQFAINSNDEELFTNALWNWDQKHKLDDTSLQLSLKLKRMFDLNELL